MDFFQAQDFFKKNYPGKNVKFEFDEKCHRFHEIVYTDGKPNPYHHIENNKVKVSIDGMDPIYVPIMPHRENATWAYMKKLINSKTDVHINNEDLLVLKNLIGQEKEDAINQWIIYTGLTKDQILAKIKALND